MHVRTRRLGLSLLLITGCMLLFSLMPTPQPVKAAFPGTNGKIVYYANAYRVHSINPDGSGDAMLASTPSAPNGSPAWSANGTKIAFASRRDGNNEIYVMNADGSNQTRLTNNAFYENFPAWSPDGTKIVFTSNRDGNYEIYVMNADGTIQTRLTTNAASDDYPVWSPDGTKIAFASDRNATPGIYTMDISGGNVTLLTTVSAAASAASDWSSDGSKLAFISGNDVCVVNADGSGRSCFVTAASERDPAWSPDGTQIAFSAGGIIYRMNADGTGRVAVTASGSNENPHWQSIPVVPPTPKDSPQVIEELPAEVTLAQRVESARVVSPGSTLTLMIVVTNRGPGDAKDATITLPLDPALLRVDDATFSRQGAWVSSLTDTALSIQTGSLGPKGDAVTATIRITVLPTAKLGDALIGKLTFTWKDRVEGGAGQSNNLSLQVGGPAFVPALDRSALENGKITFSAGIFGPREPVGFWYNTPDGQAVGLETVRANADGSAAFTLNVSGLPAGTYSMVAYSHWTEFTAVVVFVIP